jgi:hypothetical protein
MAPIPIYARFLMRKLVTLVGLLLVSVALLVPTTAAAEDRCPQSPDFSGPCPVLHFAPNYKVFKRTVQVKVKTSIEARIAVSGLLPGLGESLGTRKTIPAGKFVTFNLTIPLTLNNHLHRLSPHESLPVKFIARVNHVTGNVSTARMIVRIPGREGT